MAIVAWLLVAAAMLAVALAVPRSSRGSPVMPSPCRGALDGAHTGRSDRDEPGLATVRLEQAAQALHEVETLHDDRDLDKARPDGIHRPTPR
jgi:hypothetical protein